MTKSLSVKLVFSFWIVSLVGIIMIGILVSRTATREFGRFAVAQQIQNTASQLESYYQANGSWANLAQQVNYPPNPSTFPLERGFILTDPQGNIIYPSDFSPVEKVQPDQIARGQKLVVNGEVVGVLVSPLQNPPPRPNTNEYLSRMRYSLLVSGVVATIVSLILGFVFAKAIIKPLRELTSATRAVTGGDLDHQVIIRSKDEIGELAASFNEMNKNLKRSRDLRRQMTADIAHELRTPLSLILGHSEALSEGVLPPTADSLKIIYDEARQLTRLVEDLRTLSLDDAGELKLLKSPVEIVPTLLRLVSLYNHQGKDRNVVFNFEYEENLPEIEADPDRLTQIFTNLLDNALRFSRDNSHVTVTARQAEDEISVSIKDEGPGIASEDLDRIFERFFRANKSRNRQDGGSGLGLSIARSLVVAHGGTIQVDSQKGNGTTFTITLPKKSKDEIK